ncbi:MAG: DUF4347 domain-containing protein [Oscillatoriaceae cyanobacterium Prado104]|jgi:hypothetical protein|nr:DUF4347 domain-containing protein [Oscillatoriaceae cyanobacterium Prado104]
MNAIAFIDRSVSDSQVLAAGTVSGTEVVLLDSAADGIEQISLKLRDRSFKEVHIISHGAPGCLMLGNAILSWESLERLKSQIEMWGKSLAKNAEILIYGCRVAEGDRGRSFVERLSELTAAKIAASANFTGSKELGGDWELEVKTGEITAAKAFDSEVMAAYSHIFNSFSQPMYYPIGGSDPRSVVVSDFNNDSSPDLAVANYGSNNISILLGNGTGSFSFATNYDVGSNPNSVVVGSFNNDTFPDLAVANYGSNNISILLGNGTGGFSSANNYDVGSNPSSIAVGDFNRDSLPDLAVANSNSYNISILPGDGAGSFGLATSYSMGENPGSLAVGDFNQDLFLDLAVGNTNLESGVSILLGNSMGSFSSVYSQLNDNSISYGQPSPNSVAVGDFNNDTFSDVAVAHPGFGSTVSIFLGNGFGGFSPTAIYNGGSPTSVAVGNFNHDSFPDLATINSNSGISILLGNGTGSFSLASSYVQLSFAGSVAVGNFNNDAFTDLVTAGGSPNNVSILLGRPSVNFGAVNYTVAENQMEPVGIPITLSGVPTEDVIIYIRGGSTAAGNVAATYGSDFMLNYNVFFPAGTTNLTQNVPINVYQDNLAETDETIVLELNDFDIQGAGAGTISQTTLTIPANGTLSYAVSNGVYYGVPAPIDEIRYERNTATTYVGFTVYRSNEGSVFTSTVDYTITGTADSTTDYTITGYTGSSSGTLTFFPGEQFKSIDLNIIGDTSIEPDETIILTLSNPRIINEPFYPPYIDPNINPNIGFPSSTIEIATGRLTILNDDRTAITVNQIAGLNTTEAGGTATFTVALNSQPTAPVTIGLTSSNPAEGTVSTNNLTFDPANWNIPQTVTVTGADDSAADGTKTYTIITAPAVSTDTDYNNLNADDVTVTNTDNETPGITINPTAGLVTTESGGTANFSAVLNTLPTAPVTIALTSSNTAVGTVSTNSLTFTPANWNLPQTVTVTGVDDRTAGGSGTYQIITAPATSNDPNYSSLNPPDVSLTNTDNDTAGATISPNSTTATEGSAPGSYSINLNSQPIAPVTVSFNPGNQIGTIAPIIFDNTNWNQPQTVTVTATDDAVVEGAHSGSIAHSVTSTDPQYNGIAIAPVSVAITDNDTAPTPTPTPAPTPAPTPTPTPTPTPATPTPTPTPTPNNESAIVGFSQVNYSVNESRLSIVPATITLTRSGNLNNSSEVQIAYPTGSATADADWNTPSGFSPVITFNPGETSKTFTINILPDDLTEGTEELTFAIGSPVNANISSQNTATLRILDAGTASNSPTPTPDPTPTPTPSNSPTPTPDPTPTSTPSNSPTPTPSNSPTPTPTPSNSPTPTPDITPTPTPSNSPTPTPTPSNSPTPTPDITPTPAPSITPTPTPSNLPNNPPIINFGLTTTPWHYRTLRKGNSSWFEYQVPSGAFLDLDPGDTLTYSATLEDGKPLPNWLNFNPNLRLFSGTPSTLQWLKIKLTATDRSGASASDIILMNVTPSGVVIDSYIAGATLFLDANKNSILDANEPFTTTGSRGEFDLDIPFEIFDTNKNGELDPSEGNLVAIGGIDTATGLPLETPVTAPTDATVVTLLTSLVADAIDRGTDPEIALDRVLSALSLPADIDLLNFDPIAATNSNQPGGVEVLAAMVKVQNFITQTANLISGASTASMAAITEEVVSAIGDRIQSNGVLNFSNAATLQPIIEQAAGKVRAIDPNFDLQKILSISQQAATVMAAANQRVDSVVVNFIPSAIPTEIARVQKVALGETSQDLKAVTAGNKSIELAVSENTETALINQIQGTTPPNSPAVPIVTGETEVFSDSPNAIEGTNGDDNLIGTSNSDIFMAKRGSDFIDGNSGADTVYGGKGSDVLTGNSGGDILYGNRGTDSLIGGAGNDTLFGGKGSDRFVIATNSGIDTIGDFQAGIDLLVLDEGLAIEQLKVVENNGNALIQFVPTGEIIAVINGVVANTITTGSFSFF